MERVPEQSQSPTSARLQTTAGATAAVMAWGAVVQDLVVPDRSGRPRRVVLGFPNPSLYPEHSPHFGAIAGPFANRIRGGHCRVDGEAVVLDRNQDGRHHLHGGAAALGKRNWSILDLQEASVTLAIVTPAGLGGYPTQIHVTCRYRLLEPATLRVELEATADAPTPLNLCHHSYFTLEPGSSVRSHQLMVAADAITVADEERVPTGEVAHVAGTPYDFRTLRRIDASTPGPGFDQNFILRRAGHSPGLFHAATLESPSGDLSLEVHTTEPGLQVYDGHKLAVPVPGHDEARYGACAGIALEPQRFPDTPNHAHFGNAILRPGTCYRQVTEYRFV